ncbi:MAG: hypothetical protein K0R80_1213 [Clostridia bacterium]|jgi:glycosyltransferase involved in cell wall biosynthesis|nr:hypothetical protein [Clostridia bacterium]
MSKKVWFHMRAYNTERYIRQALDSLIKQSEPDWALWIDDNGSTDRTGEICDEYAARDKRIFCYHYKVNNQHTDKEREGAIALYNKFKIFSKEYAEYVAILDSDDYYHPDFVKIMYEAGKKYDADMVIGGTTMFKDEDPDAAGVRIPPELVIKNHVIKETDFINLYGSLRPFWGKLYSMDLWLQKDIIAPYTGEIINGFDTYQVLKLMNNCVQTSVSVAQPLHFYRIRKSSDYNRLLDVKRYCEGKILYELGIETAKTYHIDTKEVQLFLLKVYYFHVRDLIILAVKSKSMTSAEKIEFISYPLSEKLFFQCTEVFSTEIYSLLQQSVEAVLDGLDDLERSKLKRYFLVRLIEGTKETYEEKERQIWLLSALCDPENKYHWGSGTETNIDTTKTKLVIQAMNAPLSDIHVSAKQELAQAIDSGNLELALDKFNFLTSSIPLDRETLYFEMYLNLTLENYGQAVETAEIARVFWKEDEGIHSMIQMVYQIVDKKEE